MAEYNPGRCLDDRANSAWVSSHSNSWGQSQSPTPITEVLRYDYTGICCWWDAWADAAAASIYKIKIPLSYDCRNRYEGPAGIQTLGRKRSNICIKILITEPIECGFHSNSWSQSQLSVVATQTHDHRANWVSSHSNAERCTCKCLYIFQPFYICK